MYPLALPQSTSAMAYLLASVYNVSDTYCVYRLGPIKLVVEPIWVKTFVSNAEVNGVVEALGLMFIEPKSPQLIINAAKHIDFIIVFMINNFF